MPGPTRAARPLGRLAGGQAYYVPVGEMRYDRDRVRCHLCGRWLKLVGGSHLHFAHGMSVDEYREMFQLLGNVTTAAPQTSERKRATMREQIASGEREYPLPAGRPPTAKAWRSLAALRPDLLEEWDAKGNEGDPSRVGVHSKYKVWWCCRDCGHRWRQSPKIRAHGNGCPACGKRRSIAATVKRNQSPISRERALAVARPGLLAEWHPTRNAELDPYAIAAGSERQAWWRCSQCGHEWRTAVNDRTRPRPHGCPVCGLRRRAQQLARAPKDQSLAVLYPHLLAEWHPTLNGDLDPYSVKPGSERKVWWRCGACGREWQTTPAARRHSPRGGCRSCAAGRAQRERRARARHAALAER